MTFEWDPHKAKINIREHGLSFETAKLAFNDVFGVVEFDCHADGEDRLHLIGRAANKLLLLVVHVYREEYGEQSIRIISARRATPTERQEYRDASVRP